MNRFLFYILMLFMVFSCAAQDSSKVQINATTSEKPKLVVGIIIDQMRYDYLTRFYSRYGDGGFKRLANGGFNYKNTHFNYIPTKTASGHASIFTGTTPKYHGVIGNDWFDKSLGKEVYCVRDERYRSVGTSSPDGQMSPHRLLSTTFADENRIFSQMKAKSIGISIKDRGSVLPVGHTANAAYWFNGKDEGHWITSSFYMEELPKWVRDFNASNKSESYLKTWNTLYDISTYTESGPDLTNFEEGFKGKATATFPYDLAALSKSNGGYDILKSVPFGNSLTTDFAVAALDGEQLGMDDITDVLTISYSATDYVGHNFGVNAKETEDTYLRLDKDLERLFNALDTKVGRNNYTLFLTSDHGAPYAPYFLESLKIPAGLFDLNKMKAELNTILIETYGASNLILSTINNQIFLDHNKINSLGLNLENVKKDISYRVLKYKLVDKVYMSSNINQFIGQGYVENLLNNGFSQKRSGDIMIIFDPSVFKDTPWNRTGSDHGTGLSYDTHVPLFFYGYGIKHGSSIKRVNITDIAPTISVLLGISFPNTTTGDPLEEVLKK